MFEGTLIAESLRVGTSLESLSLVVRKISRYQAGGTTPDQPEVWTVLEFEADETAAPGLARAFSGALGERGWYVDFRSAAETYVVFPGQVFRYPRGDEGGRAAAKEHGRQLGIPEPQLDWTV